MNVEKCEKNILVEKNENKTTMKRLRSKQLQLKVEENIGKQVVFNCDEKEKGNFKTSRKVEQKQKCYLLPKKGTGEARLEKKGGGGRKQQQFGLSHRLPLLKGSSTCRTGESTKIYTQAYLNLFLIYLQNIYLKI